MFNPGPEALHPKPQALVKKTPMVFFKTYVLFKKLKIQVLKVVSLYPCDLNLYSGLIIVTLSRANPA